MSSLLEALYSHSVTSPNRLCIVDADGEHSYKSTMEISARFAAVYSRLGIARGSRILVECNQKASYIAADAACWITGCVFVPFESRSHADRVKAIADEVGPALIIADSSYSLACPTISYAELLEKSIGVEPSELPIINGDDTAEILFTTGTTGKSKGIEISHSNNVAIAENIIFGTEMKAGNVELIPLPASHSHGLRTTYASIYAGNTVILIDGVMDIRRIFRLVEDYSVTALDLSPTAVVVLMKLGRDMFSELDSKLDYIEIGTAALSEDVKQQLKEKLPSVRLYNFYGSTESGRSCVLNFNSDDDRKFCVGKPSKNARFIVTDDEHNEINSSEELHGLLACSGEMNMRGYFKNPELTASICRNGYIFTNDEAYIDRNGYIFILGRRDDVINYKGIKIAPEEIEDVAKKYPGIADCACVGKKDPVSGQYPHLFVKLGEGTFDMKAFNKYLRENIDSSRLPLKIEIIPDIPRTFNGKLQRNLLR